jgi:AraC-like DNA-binding protein
MKELQTQRLVRWCTDAVPPAQRLDYYASALAAALVPMHLGSSAPESFHYEMTMADLGLLSVLRQCGSGHRAYHAGASDVRTYHLVINLTAPWLVTHRGRARLNPGDAMLFDSMLAADMMADDYQVTHLKLSEAWVKQWLPAPGVLVGRPIPADSGWGRALTSYAAQLSPQFVVDSPLPVSVITDHVGALLALIADQIASAKPSAARAETDLLGRIKDTIVQRCTDPGLTTDLIAESLSISTRTLHRTLAAFGETFGARLMAARVDVAVRMLESPLSRRLTAAEIGRRSGFADASHFSRVLRGRTGRTPTQWRRGAASEEVPETAEVPQ